ncbi:N-acetylglucosamine-6-phosphate deacetylase [Oscillospiraceae bacterium PP1C4]
MKTYIKSKRIYTQSGCVSGILVIEDGKIAELLSYDSSVESAVEDYSNDIIIPGIIDIHNHGFKGKSVCAERTQASRDELDEYLRRLTSVGVTGVTPTATPEYFGIIADAVEQEHSGAQILGIYSEGPFGTRVGENAAEEFDYLKPDLKLTEDFIKKARGQLKIMSIAPEAEGADKVIDYLLSQGITVAAYHTNANFKQMKAGFDKGISLVTHTGNVMTGIHHRDIGALGAALLDEHANCEIITDFYHLCPEMLKLMFKIKDYSKFILVSDSVVLSGVEPGEYTLMANIVVTVGEDGYIRDKGGRLCGSSKYVLYGMRNLVKELGIPMERVIEMASLNPAKILGASDTKGSIAKGKDADLAVLDADFNCLATYVRGKLEFKV